MWLCLRYGKGICAHYMVGLFICNHDVLFCPRQRGAWRSIVCAVSGVADFICGVDAQGEAAQSIGQLGRENGKRKQRCGCQVIENILQ